MSSIRLRTNDYNISQSTPTALHKSPDYSMVQPKHIMEILQFWTTPTNTLYSTGTSLFQAKAPTAGKRQSTTHQTISVNRSCVDTTFSENFSHSKREKF